MHHWTEGDDLAALYVFLFDTTGLPYSIQTIARRRGIEPATFRMRLQNFRAIAGLGGLDHYSHQSESVYRQHGRKRMEDLRTLAFPELSSITARSKSQ